MKKVFALCIGVLLFTACEQDTILPEIEEINVEESTLARQIAKVDVCHKGKIINVSVNALPAHQGHGDAVDMDGDGYFDIENDCSDVDLDDSIPFDQSTLVDEDGDGFFTTENPFSEIDIDDTIAFDQSVLVDDDDDGFFTTENPFSDIDCDDTDATINPDATEVPYDGIDNDCDPLTLDDDLDEDGYINDEDCDDTNADVNPAMEEVCDDNIDNNCNGEIDENCVPEIGQYHQGGIVFWVDATGQHGLIFSIEGVSFGTNWWEARDYCKNYSQTVDGVIYDDWRLPSKDELNKFYLFVVDLLDPSANFLGWSSTVYDYSDNAVWCQVFGSFDGYGSGYQLPILKSVSRVTAGFPIRTY